MKLKFILAFSLSVVTVFSACKKDKSPAPPADPELLGPENSKVLHYSFNGHLNDGSGNSFNAEDSTNVSYTADRFMRGNQAISLDPSNGISSVITPNLSSSQISFPFSVSLWFKADTIFNGETILRADGGESFNYYGYWIQFFDFGENNPNIGLAFSYGNGGTPSGSSRNTLYSPGGVFTANQWYHLVVNVRGRNDMDMYVNGAKLSNTTYDGGAGDIEFSQNGQGTIGMYVGQGRYKGKIDDYRVYKKVLSAGEVSTLYNFQP